MYESKLSTTMLGVLKYADRVYILCTDECDTLVIPEDLGLDVENKVWEKTPLRVLYVLYFILYVSLIHSLMYIELR